MRAIDSLGEFWLPGHEDDSLSGRIRFDPQGDNGITLTLVGEFDHEPIDDDGEPNIRILGWLGNDRVTLDRGFSLSGRSFRSPGITESSYCANRLFLGHHIEGIDLEFRTVSLLFGVLPDWVDKSGLTEDDQLPQSYSMRFTPLAEESHRFSRGRVSLDYGWERKGNPIRGVTFRQWPGVRLVYDNLQSFEEVIRKDAGRIQSLITLCVDEPVDLDQFTLTRPDVRIKAISGEEMPIDQPIEFVASPLRYRPPEERKPRHWHQMLLNYEELGGVAGIARWIDASEEFQRPLDSFMSIKHARNMFAENRFLNVTFAAEAYHRVTQGGTNMDPATFEELFDSYLEKTPEEHHDWLRQKLGHGNEPPLRKRLHQLAARSGPATRPLIGDKGDWAYTLTQVRNDLTHLGGDTSRFWGGDLVFLAESVYAVVRTCMLLESGVSLGLLTEKANSPQIAWYRDRLQRALDRVRDQLSLNPPMNDRFG